MNTEMTTNLYKNDFDKLVKKQSVKKGVYNGKVEEY